MDAVAMEPYKALIVALLEQAIKDIRHGRPEVRQSATRWLHHDSSCAELCDMIGLNREALTEALQRDLVST